MRKEISAQVTATWTLINREKIKTEWTRKKNETKEKHMLKSVVL